MAGHVLQTQGWDRAEVEPGHMTRVAHPAALSRFGELCRGDTICIDKTSSAELSEAINSMYRWYQESVVCYAYLDDVSSSDALNPCSGRESEFSRSRWFTRGWALQELIAPPVVVFLDQKWQEIGTKSSLQGAISAITGIPTSILLRGGPRMC